MTSSKPTPLCFLFSERGATAASCGARGQSLQTSREATQVSVASTFIVSSVVLKPVLGLFHLTHLIKLISSLVESAGLELGVGYTCVVVENH